MRISDWSSDVCSSDLPARVTDLRCESGDNRRVADVRLLRGACHGQMHAHQPCDQIAVRPVELVPAAESPPIDCTQFGMVAAASLGDRKRVVWGKKVAVRVDLCGSRILKKKKTK